MLIFDEKFTVKEEKLTRGHHSLFGEQYIIQY